MANATRKVLAGHGADPRELALIAYGGNGGVHAWAIAPELGIETVLVPKTAPAFSALGVLVADYVIDLVRSYVAPLSQVDMQRVGALAAELLDEAEKELTPADLEPGSVAYDLYAQMCYPGQNFDLSIPMPAELSSGTAGDAGDAIAGSSLLELAERFHDQHEAERGFCFRNMQPLLRGVRVVGRGATPKPGRLTTAGAGGGTRPRGSRPAYFDGAFHDTPVHSGPDLAAGDRIQGPALVEEPFTVVVVPPGTSLELDDLGNYLLRS